MINRRVLITLRQQVWVGKCCSVMLSTRVGLHTPCTGSNEHPIRLHKKQSSCTMPENSRSMERQTSAFSRCSIVLCTWKSMWGIDWMCLSILIQHLLVLSHLYHGSDEKHKKLSVWLFQQVRTNTWELNFTFLWKLVVKYHAGCIWIKLFKYGNTAQSHQLKQQLTSECVNSLNAERSNPKCMRLCV